MIRNIQLEEALPGMVLGDDVAHDGHVLLPRGTVITTAHLAGLRRREVAAIAILAPCELTAAEMAERREAQQERVAHLFRRAGSDATTQALLRAVLEYRVDKRV